MTRKKTHNFEHLPKIIDLFAGAGGLSLGAIRAGFLVSSAVEIDSRAMATHRMNFSTTAHVEKSVAHLTGTELLESAGLRRGELTGLIGGPPCQGYSFIGIAKARDPRNTMFRQFMRLVAETRPAFFLAENVPGILNTRHARRIQSALALVPRSYTVLAPFTVRASDFGAPTSRERVIFFGYDRKRVDDLDIEDFEAAKVDATISVRTALHGLPMEISPDWTDEKASWRPVHVTKTGKFFDRIVGNLPKGAGDPITLEKYFNDKRVHGNFGTRHSTKLIRRYGALEYGESDPITKSVRLDPAGLCPTLRAGTGPDAGSFQAVRPIHYLRPRVITPREAARLQGFPDWFRFDRTKWHSFRQIGNSVSPILAEALLLIVAGAIRA